MIEKAEQYSELAKKRGKRVHDRRIELKLTQNELASMCNYGNPDDVNRGGYISRIEHGERPLNDWNVAAKLGEALNVPAEYLMWGTDSRTVYREFLEEEYFKEDMHFINHLIYKGNTIKAYVTLIYDPEQIKQYVAIDKIKGFKLSTPECACIIDGATHEAIITDIVINNYQIPFHIFTYIIDMIYKYIDFTIDNIPNFIDCFIADNSFKDKINNIINTSLPYNDTCYSDPNTKKGKK